VLKTYEHLKTLKEVENQMITITLAAVSGHRNKAALLLGIDIRTLQHKLAKRIALDKKGGTNEQEKTV